jgi:hypothetical protein
MEILEIAFKNPSMAKKVINTGNSSCANWPYTIKVLWPAASYL